MESIRQQEIEAVEGFLTFSMVRDAGNVMRAHRAVAESLFTGKVTCACGHVIMSAKSSSSDIPRSWRDTRRRRTGARR